MITELELSSGPLPPPPADGQLWSFPQGGEFAFCSQSGSGFRIDLPGRASFLFEAGSPSVVAHASQGMTYERVRTLFDHDVLPMVLQARGFEVLHASAARFPRGAGAFCADSGVGKSTLAAAFHLAGSEMIADDALALDGLVARPLPFAARLRPETASRFGSIDGSAGAGLPLAALFLLQRSDALDVQPLKPAEALPGLLRHAYCFSLADPLARERLMRRYLDLAARVPVYRLLFPPGFDLLPATLDRIRSLLSS